MTRLPLSLTATALIAGIGAGAAYARPAQSLDVFSTTPTVHIAVPTVESQAQLADQLRALGYTDVVLSSVYATPANPRPQANPAFTSNPQGTPVHEGWNGVAVKDGQIVQVYADQ
jgi:hypothetical protein